MKNKTAQETQISFVASQDLKQKAMAKAKADGITLKALFVMAMKSYVNNELSIGLLKEDKYYDELFADKEVIKRANRLGRRSWRDMRIVFTESFLKKEYRPLAKYFSLDELRKILTDSGHNFIPLSSLGYDNGRLLKMKISRKAASWMIAYVFFQNDLFVPLVFRLKKDKLFGENLSSQNKEAKKLIIKMMDLAIEDIENEDFE